MMVKFSICQALLFGVKVKFDFLLFDLDGTLVDSQKDLAAAANATRKDFNFPPLSVEQIRSYVGNGIKVLVKKALPDLKENEIDDAVKKFNNHYEACLLDQTKPYDGINEMLEAFKDVKKAILTNKNEKFTRMIVKGLGWDGKFEQIIGGDTFPIKKPDPQIVFEMMKKLNADPAKTIMIGDGINDIKSAKGANIASLAVFYGFTERKVLETLTPNFTAQTPKDIIALLSSLRT